MRVRWVGERETVGCDRRLRVTGVWRETQQWLEQVPDKLVRDEGVASEVSETRGKDGASQKDTCRTCRVACQGCAWVLEAWRRESILSWEKR